MLYLRTFGKAPFIREIKVLKDRNTFVVLNGKPVVTSEGVEVQVDFDTLVIREGGGRSYSMAVDQLPGNSLCSFNGRGIWPVADFRKAQEIARSTEGDKRVRAFRKAKLSHLLPVATAS